MEKDSIWNAKQNKEKKVHSEYIFKTNVKPMLSDGPRRLLASEWSDSSPQMSKVSENSQVKNRK